MDKQTNQTNFKVLAALGLMMTSQQVNAVAISSTESALLEHRHKSHHHHRHHQDRPDESDNLIIGAPKSNQNQEQLAERRTLDVVREELQAELHNSDDEQEHQENSSDYSKPEKEQEEIKPQQMAQYEQQIEEYKPEPIVFRKPVQASKTADLIAQAIIHQNQKAQGMSDEQIYGGASASANDESEFGFGSTAQVPKPIAEKIQQIEQKPTKTKFQMAEISEPIVNAQENAVQKTLQLIKSRQATSPSTFVQKPKSLFPIFDKPALATAEEEEVIVPIAPPKKVVIHKKQTIKKPRVMSEEEKAQAEIDAMLEVEKRQESLRNKQVGGSSKSLVQDSKPAAFGGNLDMHVDSSIIDKVRKDTDKEMADIDNEAQRTSVAQSKAEESSSDEEQEMTEQEKLYGRQEKPERHHKSKPQPVQQKLEEAEIVPEIKPKYNLSQSNSAEDAKQMAVQKTLDLINKFKKNENLEQASISPTMSLPEPVQASIVHHAPSTYNKDTAIQKILETIRQKHNLPPVASKKPQAAVAFKPLAPKKAEKRTEIQEIQDKIDRTKLEMRKLPNAPEYGIETSKLDIDESEFVTKAKPVQAQVIRETVAPPKVETKKMIPQKQDNVFQIETTKMDIPDFESPKQEAAPIKKAGTVLKSSDKKGGKPQILQQKKTSEGNEYKIETTSVDMDSLKSIVGDTSDLDLEKMQAQELSKIQAEKKQQERLRKEAEEKRLEDIRIEKERVAAEKKAAEEEEEHQRQEILQEQVQRMKKLQQEEDEIKAREMKLKQEAQQQAKTLKSLEKLPLTVPVINNKDPKVSQSLSEQPKTIPGEINQMNNNMRGMLKEIVETIQPALEESVGPENNAAVKVVVTPKALSLGQAESSKKAQEFTFNDTRSLNAKPSDSAPAVKEADIKKTEDVKKVEETKPETQAKKPEAFPATPLKAEEMKPAEQVSAPPKPMTPPTAEKVEAPAKTEAVAGPTQSAIQNAIQATLSKIKADKSLEQKSVEDFKKETEKIEQERKVTEAKTEALEKVQQEKEEANEKTKLSNLKDSVVANAIKAGKAKQAEKKKLQEQIKKKQDQAKALAKQETENMNDLIKVGEATHKNPLISNVVANTIALMKKQKGAMNASPFSHLFDTLHGDALMQQSESAKVTLPVKTAVKTQAAKASIVNKSLIQLGDNEEPVDIRVKVDVEDKGNGPDQAAEAKLRNEERAAHEKKTIEEEANCAKERGLKDAQDKIEEAKKAAKAADKKRNKEIEAHDRQQARDEEKERQHEATGKRVDKEYKDGRKIVGITMDAANKAQQNSQEAVNAAGSAAIVDNRKPDDSADKKEQAAKDAVEEKEQEKKQDQSSGELVSAKKEVKDIQSALDKVTYTEEKEKFLKEQEDKKIKASQEAREKALKEQKEKEKEARKEDEMRDKIVKETNDQIKARQAKEAADQKDREEAKALKELTIFKDKQDKLNKERKEREAQSKKESEEKQKQEFALKEQELEANQRKIDLEKKKLEDKLRTEKEMEEKEKREAQQKAKYDKAFRDGEIHKQQEYTTRTRAEAEKKREEQKAIREWEQKQQKQEKLESDLENTQKQQARDRAEKEKAEQRQERERREQREDRNQQNSRYGDERENRRDERQSYGDRRGGYDQQQQNSGYGWPPQQRNYGNNGNNGNNYGNNGSYQNNNQGYDNLAQKSKPVEVRKSISTAQVVATAPKAAAVTIRAPAKATAAPSVPVATAKPSLAKTEEKPKAPVVAAKASVAKVTPPKDNSQDKGSVLIQREDKQSPSTIILDQKDEKDTELFNKADVQDENWLQLTFHKIGMNVKSVFNKLFLPQLESSNLSHQEKIELMMLWEEHHDQDDK